MSLAKTLARLYSVKRSNVERPVDDKPRSAYELVTRQMVADLRRDLDDVKSLLRWLWFLVFATFITTIVDAILPRM
ncbi:MAG: hypothetical protein AB1566_13235 [Chloroflexota bacterium]